MLRQPRRRRRSCRDSSVSPDLERMTFDAIPRDRLHGSTRSRQTKAALGQRLLRQPAHSRQAPKL